MDQTHTRAMEALQPFIHLANSSNASSPRVIANLVTNATSSPNTYVFAELLETPAVQALSKDSEFAGYLTLLEIFAWGTWQEYQKTPNLPQLTPPQALKLRLLSLLSLSSTTKPLTYSTLMTALSISAPSELESLVTTAIYSNLITARLSPASKPPSINVTSVAPLRDVKPQSLPAMITVLDQWETRCGTVIGDIEAQIARIRAESSQRKTKTSEREEALQKALADFESGESTGTVLPGISGGPRTRRGGGGGGQKKGGITAARERMFGGGSGGNKREFNADEWDDGDDGYWDEGAMEGPSSAGGSSRMDIDEGAGSARLGVRQAKRVLGKKS